ncbi:ATP-dependent DNA/RNA helicase DHX36 [Nilaparvata lugens]|uniref:ATP-dependent DNA/RNA helicase DHX36 n=1 Tax=Nilaparvata lugens TaxID=108931 RepID=UPI00193E0446|nr:ATP-dependent DNA/RNA helicase DHX36 [Nilaparvata lugens]
MNKYFVRLVGLFLPSRFSLPHPQFSLIASKRFHGNLILSFWRRMEIPVMEGSGGRYRRGRGGSMGRHPRRGSHYRAGRGGGGGRGGRYREEHDEGRSQSGDRSPSDRPPPGLRGKEIGLWYKNKHRRMKAEGKEIVRKKDKSVKLKLESSLFDSIKDFVNSLKSKPPQHLVQKYKSMKREVKEEPNAKVKKEKKVKEERGSKIKEERGIKIKEERSDLVDYSRNEAPPRDKYSHIKESRFKTDFIRSITGNIEDNIDNSLSSRSRNVVRVPRIDEELKAELSRKRTYPSYQRMINFRRKLPSFKMQEEILDVVDKNQVIVISGETGCGKTTQVAQFILDDQIERGNGSKCRIICTQPRRISAISVAERVADERAEKIGESVGYQIRVEKILPRTRGSILFCTTGILLKFIVSDPALSDVSHIIIDEIHERDTISDFAITILKSILEKRRDLKLILMSATLNAERFSTYYDDCPKLEIPGFTFPVTEYYLEDVLQMTRYNPNNSKDRKKFTRKPNARKLKEYDDFIMPYIRHMQSTKQYDRKVLDYLRDPVIEEIDLDLIKSLVEFICYQVRKDGAILIFLPGLDKITALNKILTESGKFPPGKFLIIPLHSLLPTTQQKTVFDRPPAGVRKIVIATNIAETSITIDDIVYVIDSGKIKMKNFDVQNNITTLQAEWVSLANARQRRGRAGRVQEGVCYHLYTKPREMMLADYQLPEMLRTRLEEVILQAKILQVGHIKPFLQKVLDPPNPAAIDLSLKMLVDMNALDDDESLTPLGHHLAQLPVDPQIGKMILMAALFNCVDPIFSVAASLGFKDAFVVPLNKENEVNVVRDSFDMGRKSDHLLMAEAFSQWERAEHDGYGWKFCSQNFLIRNILFLLRDMKEQFAGYLYDMKFLPSKDHKQEISNKNSNDIGLLRAIICAGLYPNVAIIRGSRKKNRGNPRQRGPKLFTVEDGKVELHPRSVNQRCDAFESNYLMYHLKLKSTGIFVHDSTMVHPLPLFFFGHSVNITEEDGKTVFELSHRVRFAIDPDAAKVILDLRMRLDWILEQKISNPGVIDWNLDTEEVLVLGCIAQLISHENSDLMDDEFGGGSDFSDSDIDNI